MEQQTQTNLMKWGFILGITVIVGFFTENIIYGIITFVVTMIMSESAVWCYAFCQLNTRGFFANVGIKGHSSIIEDDVVELWSPYEKDKKFICFRPGGSRVWWMPFHGMGDVYIINSELVTQANGMTIAYGDYFCCLNKKRNPDFSQIPLDWQNKIINSFSQERMFPFKPDKHKVWIAFSRGSSVFQKEKNISYSSTIAEQESLITTLRNRVDELQQIINSGIHTSNLMTQGGNNSRGEEHNLNAKYKYVRVE